MLCPWIDRRCSCRNGACGIDLLDCFEDPVAAVPPALQAVEFPAELVGPRVHEFVAHPHGERHDLQCRQVVDMPHDALEHAREIGGVPRVPVDNFCEVVDCGADRVASVEVDLAKLHVIFVYLAL